MPVTDCSWNSLYSIFNSYFPAGNRSANIASFAWSSLRYNFRKVGNAATLIQFIKSWFSKPRPILLSFIPSSMTLWNQRGGFENPDVSPLGFLNFVSRSLFHAMSSAVHGTSVLVSFFVSVNLSRNQILYLSCSFSVIICHASRLY